MPVPIGYDLDVYKRQGLHPLAIDEILEDLGRGVAENGGGSQSVGCHNCSLNVCLNIDATAGMEGAAREGKLRRRMIARVTPETQNWSAFSFLTNLLKSNQGANRLRCSCFYNRGRHSLTHSSGSR